MSGYMHLQGKAASDYLRAKKARKVPQTKPIQVGFYEEEGSIVKVVTGAWLGSIELFRQPDNSYASEGVFRGKKYPISVVFGALGTVPLYRRFLYNTQELDPEQPVANFLPFLEDYRAEALTPEQRAKLSAISLVDLHAIQRAFFIEHEGNWAAHWTPWIDAVNSIMQSDNGMNDTFPKRKYIIVPHYQDEDGHKVVGVDVALFVNGAKFVAGEGAVSYCNGTVYKYFTWDAAMGIFPDGLVYYPDKPVGDNEDDE